MGWKDKVNEFAGKIQQQMLDPKDIEDYIASEREQAQADPLGYAKEVAQNQLEGFATPENLMLGGFLHGSVQGPRSLGWSKAANKYSGLWDKMQRAQVSDVGQSLTPEAHQMLRKTGGARFAMDNLENKVASGELSPAQAHAIIQDAKGIFPEGMTLKDIYKHPTMEKNYPEIYRDTPVTFEYVPDKTKGWIDSNGGYHVNLSQINSAEDWLGNLVHEIGTHKIQNLEGFSKGTSIGNIRNMKDYLLREIPGMPNLSREERTLLYNKVGKVNPVAEYAESAGETEARYNREIMKKSLDEILGMQPLSTEEIPLKHLKNSDTWEWGPRRALKDISLREEPLAQSPKDIAEGLGFPYRGIYGRLKDKGDLHMFDDPVTGSTFSLPESEFTAENVIKRIQDSRKQNWKPEQMDWSKDPLKTQEDLDLGGKPTPAQAIDRWYKSDDPRAAKDLALHGKYGENPYDYTANETNAIMMNAQDEGPTGMIPYIKRRAANLGLPEDVQAAQIAQSGARRNYQLHPVAEKALDDFLNEHLDMTPKAKKPLPFENKPVEVIPEKAQQFVQKTNTPAARASWYDELTQPIFQENDAIPDVDKWAQKAKADSEMADDLRRMEKEKNDALGRSRLERLLRGE